MCGIPLSGNDWLEREIGSLSEVAATEHTAVEVSARGRTRTEPI